MADLTFESAVETIVSMKGEIIQALGETFIMVGLSTTFAVIFGTILGVLLFVTSSHQLHYNKQLNLFLDNLVDRKSTRLNSSHPSISYAVFCLKKKKIELSSRFRIL